jgi:hypothetical protein
MPSGAPVDRRLPTLWVLLFLFRTEYHSIEVQKAPEEQFSQGDTQAVVARAARWGLGSQVQMGIS